MRRYAIETKAFSRSLENINPLLFELFNQRLDETRERRQKLMKGKTVEEIKQLIEEGVI